MMRMYEEDNSVLNYNRNGLNSTWTNDHGVQFTIPGLTKKKDEEPISDAGAVGIMSVGFLVIGLILL